MELSIDYIMIVGKYFECESDFINVVKVCRRFHDLIGMYKFNPISNAELFPNIETQHFYYYRDIFYRRRNMFRYVYWIEPFMLEKYMNIIDCERCVIKNTFLNKVFDFCKHANLGFGEFHTDGIIERLQNMTNGYVVFKYVTVYFGFVIKDSHLIRCFSNSNVTDARLWVSKSTLYKKSRCYLREDRMNVAVTITEKSDSSIEIVLESDRIWPEIPQHAIIIHYLIVDTD